MLELRNNRRAAQIDKLEDRLREVLKQKELQFQQMHR
jgi:hypothetical protein